MTAFYVERTRNNCYCDRCYRTVVRLSFCL